MAYYLQTGYGSSSVLLESHLEAWSASKVRVFAWRLGHDLLPTNVKIANINPIFNRQCRRCKVADETAIHALRDCDYACATLTNGGIDNRIMSSTRNNAINWLEASMRWLDSKAFYCFMIIFLNIWNTRNNLVFKGEERDPKTTWEKAVLFSKDFDFTI